MDPVKTLTAVTRRLYPRILDVINSENISDFDAKFGEIEADLNEWKTTFDSIDMKIVPQRDAATKLGELVYPFFRAIEKRSIELQSNLGRNLPAAAAAGGRKRKMTRRYCKKTPCRKMGFTQKASCRPWKNCYKNKK